jgi:hypothetical protein
MKKQITRQKRTARSFLILSLPMSSGSGRMKVASPWRARSIDKVVRKRNDWLAFTRASSLARIRSPTRFGRVLPQFFQKPQQGQPFVF